MEGKYSSLLFYLIIFSTLSSTFMQNIEVRQLSDSLNRFAVKFLAVTSKQAGDNLNLALSPYTTWSLLSVIYEGALENTAAELRNVLGILPMKNKETLRTLYKTLGNQLNRPSKSEVTLETKNEIFTTDDQPLKSSYLDVVRNFYNVEITPVDFKNTANAMNIINDHVGRITKGRISQFIKEDDIQDAEIFMASVLFFRGYWDTVFNKSDTAKEPFYDDGENQIGEVDMMYNVAPFPFALILNGKANAIELPYKGNLSMVAIVPKRKMHLQTVLNALAEVPFSSVIDELDKSTVDFEDEPVKVFLPKFCTISDLSLNVVLDQMGVKDAFNPDTANLLGMFNNYLHISRMLQRAEIKVDEEGSIASSATGASFEYKIQPPKFYANKPFAYFIYDKESRGIIFAGKLSNPKDLTC